MPKGGKKYGEHGFDDGGSRSTGKTFGFDDGGSRGKKTAAHGFDDAGRKAPRESSTGTPGNVDLSSI